MSATYALQDAAGWRSRLDCPAYPVRDAARYAGIPTRTVGYWHRGALNRPAALPGREAGRPLSYYELIEVAFVATFRKLGLSLQKIRKARAFAAHALNSEYPFAQYAWKTKGFHLMLEMRELEEDAEVGKLVAVDLDGQVDWEEVVAERFEQFDYQHDIALVWHLVNRDIPVSIDPRVSFGAPVVHGVPTWILKGRWDAGETVQNIQDDYGLTGDDVLHGLRFEGVRDDELAMAS